MDIKPNFFTGNAQPAPVSMSLIQWMNDSQYRVAAGTWMYENFDDLVAEYKQHKRFLSLAEINDSIL